MKKTILTDKYFFAFFAVLLTYSITFIAIAIWRYDNFCLHDSGDLLLFEQVIYNTGNGKIFYNNFSGHNHFGDHNSPALAVLVPFAAIFQVPYVLYASTVLSIALSAIPIYLIARKNLNNGLLTLLVTTSYLMLPALVGQTYQSFHEINLVLPFLTFAFYYFIEERFYPFIAVFAMGLMVKEDVSLTLFMFSIYALIKRRSMKWCLIPAILSMTWLALSIKVIIPFFSRSHSYHMISYFSNLGGSFGELISNTIFHPLDTLKELTQPNKLFYLFVLLLPVGLILPFFSLEFIFIIPSMFFNLFAGTQRFRLIDFGMSGILPLPRHMSLVAAVFIFISTIYGLQKIKRNSTIAVVVSSLILISMTVYSAKFILRPELYHRPSMPTPATINKVVALIPKDATVKTSIDVSNHLYDRKEVYVFGSSIETDFIVVTAIHSGEALKADVKDKYNFVVLEKDIFLLKKK